jgi:hypothetical protein
MSAAIALPKGVQEMSATEAKAALVRDRRRNQSMKRAVSQDTADVLGATAGIVVGTLLSGVGIPLPGGRRLSVNLVAGGLGLVMLFTDNPLSRSYGRRFTQSLLMGMGTVDAVQMAANRVGSLGSLSKLFGG